jgi:hypothetical protein
MVITMADFPRSDRDPYRNTAGDTGQAGPQSDPLAELARLIGQNNPFSDGGRGSMWPDPRQPSSPPSTNWRPGGGDAAYGNAPPVDVAEQEAASLPGRWQGIPYVEPAEQTPEADPTAYDQGYEQQPPAYAYQPAPEPVVDPGTQYYGDQPDYADQASAPRKSGLVTIIAIAVIAVVGTAGAYAYRTIVSGRNLGSPPVIKADINPAKVVPTIQAGEGAGNKRITDRLGDGSQSERMVSREEQPVDMQSQQSTPRVTYPSLANNPAALGTAGGATEPRKVKTVTIPRDQAPAAPGAVPPPAAAVPAPRAAAPPAATAPTSTATAPSRNAASASGNSPMLLVPQDNDLPAPTGARTAQPSQTVAALPPGRTREPASAATGNFVVQLSAQKTQDEAALSFKAMQTKYPSVLGGRRPLIRKKDLGDKGVFYAAQVGPFSNRDDAASFCEQLKAAGGACLVQKN